MEKKISKRNSLKAIKSQTVQDIHEEPITTMPTPIKFKYVQPIDEVMKEEQVSIEATQNRVTLPWYKRFMQYWFGAFK